MKYLCNSNGLPRTLKNTYAHQRATTVSSNDSLQLRPFSKRELLKEKKNAPRGSEFFPLRAVPLGMENYFYHIR